MLFGPNEKEIVVTYFIKTPYILANSVEVHIFIINTFSKLLILNNKASCKPKYVKSLCPL